MSNQADYQLALYTPYFELVDVLPMSRVLNMSYELVVNGISNLTVTLDGEDPAVGVIADNSHLDYLAVVYRRNVDSFEQEKTFFIRAGDLFQVEETGRENLVFAGVSLESLLGGRILLPDDDPVGAAGFVTRDGSGDAVMMEYVNYQCISPVTNTDRAIPNLVEGTYSSNFIHTFQRRKQEDNLLDILQDIAKQSFVDFWIDFNETQFVFNAGRVGTDRSQPTNYPANPFVLFTTMRNNLRAPRLKWDRRDEITWMYVAGQGLGETRIYVPVGSGRAIDSPYNRREATIDAKTNDALDEIISQGQAELTRNQPIVEFTFEVAPLAGGGRYNVDWFLGDIVTAQWQNYVADYRIIGVKVEVSDSGEMISPVTKNPPFGG